MKESTTKGINNKLFILIVLIILIIFIAIAGTYAWFTWSSKENTDLTMTIGGLADVTISSGGNINVENMGPVFSYEDGAHTSITINNKSGNSINHSIKMSVSTISDSLKSTLFKYKLLKVADKNKTEVTSGDFSNASNGNDLIILNDVLPSGTTIYDFVIYIDSNSENNPEMMGGKLNGTILVSASEISVPTGPFSLIEKLDNDFSDDGKSLSHDLVRIDDLQFDYNPRNYLMMDAWNNLRFYGTEPNNYIYFNCTNPSDVSTCEKWRIVGVFQNSGTRMVKIVKEDSVTNSDIGDGGGSALMDYYSIIEERMDAYFIDKFIEQLPQVFYSDLIVSTDALPSEAYISERNNEAPSMGAGLDLLNISDIVYSYSFEFINSKKKISESSPTWIAGSDGVYWNFCSGATGTGKKCPAFYSVSGSTSIVFGEPLNSSGYRPSLYLKDDTCSTGDGTIDNPYHLDYSMSLIG